MGEQKYDVLSDEEIEQALKNRIHDLEGQHYSQVLYLAEAEADPHAPAELKKQHREQAESLQARLELLRQRQATFKASKPSTSAQPQQ